MGLMAVAKIPHTAPCKPGIDGYRQYGCKCDEGCRAANAKYTRDRRARLKSAEKMPDNVRPMRARRGKPTVGGDVLNGRVKQGKSDGPEPDPGPNEQAVINACANLIIDDGPVTETRPDVVIGARTMARLLDDPERLKEHAAARRQLRYDMDSLREHGKTKSKGRRLAAIRNMTNRRPPEGVSR